MTTFPGIQTQLAAHWSQAEIGYTCHGLVGCLLYVADHVIG